MACVLKFLSYTQEFFLLLHLIELNVNRVWAALQYKAFHTPFAENVKFLFSVCVKDIE